MGFSGGTYGEASAGPRMWVDSNRSDCDSTQPDFYGPYRIYCFMVDRAAPLPAPPAVAGKRIWISKDAWTPAGGKVAADAVCQAEKPLGVAQATALMTTTTQPAAGLLDPAATYVRPGDGIPVGTGADLIALSKGQLELEAGPWTAGDGSYVTNGYFYFSGIPRAGDATSLGTAASTCDDWTGTSNTGTGGIWARTNVLFWNQYTGPCNQAQGYHLLCVEKK
jgi:hypothetical protein